MAGHLYLLKASPLEAVVPIRLQATGRRWRLVAWIRRLGSSSSQVMRAMHSLAITASRIVTGRDLPPPDTDKSHRVALVDGQWIGLRDVPRTLPVERDTFFGRASDLSDRPLRFAEGARLVVPAGPRRSREDAPGHAIWMVLARQLPRWRLTGATSHPLARSTGSCTPPLVASTVLLAMTPRSSYAA